MALHFGYQNNLHVTLVQYQDPSPYFTATRINLPKNRVICLQILEERARESVSILQHRNSQKQAMLKAQQTCTSHAKPCKSRRQKKERKKENRDSRFKKRTISIEPNSKEKKTESLWVHIREKRKFQHPTYLDARLAVIST